MTISPPTDPVQLSSANGIAVVTLNRPGSRNALTLEMYDRLAEIFSSTQQLQAKAIIVTGSGSKAFAAGTEISTFRDMRTPDQAHAYEAQIDSVLDTIERCPVPTIAAMSGACTGGGAAVAACCDIRLATSDLQFGFPIARTLGNCLSVSSISRLTALVGAGRVAELLLTARLITAEEAKSAGLVSEVLGDHAGTLRRALELGEAMSRLAPLTLRASKEALRRLREAGAEAEDSDLIAMCYMSEDFREGVEAFIAKRPPQWKGR